MHHEAADRLRLGMDIRAAVDRDEFVLHYQPIVHLPERRDDRGMEALLRWVHPERGLIAPSEFIPLAESTGLIVPLGEFVLREACRQARAWQRERPDAPPLMMSVNLSGIQLQHPGLVAAVSLALEDAELAPELLTLEVTESVLAHETDDTVRRLRQLKGLGVTSRSTTSGRATRRSPTCAASRSTWSRSTRASSTASRPAATSWPWSGPSSASPTA